nr:immunoglobulin light chain junction region [Macaca mulatta]MOV78712.1 immunoglobulin light chain junction region [Macaca mulatta]MOV80545.1 immunoglobulin light chain junction region [Macaca mulatta]MOV80989.1 immunoglobulin light chain junction region [Macaca mulatta]MOV81324.1 immunoglobulin light chain junction region [Macaca mulatta]
CHQYNNLPLTF